MDLHTLPDHVNWDTWAVPPLLLDNFSHLVPHTEPEIVAEIHATYIHMRHRASHLLITCFQHSPAKLTDVNALVAARSDYERALANMEQCLTAVELFIKKPLPIVSGLGAAACYTRHATRNHDWEGERLVLLHNCVALTTQLVFLQLRQPPPTTLIKDVDAKKIRVDEYAVAHARRTIQTLLTHIDTVTNTLSDTRVTSTILCTPDYYRVVSDLLIASKYHWAIFHAYLPPVANVTRFFQGLDADVSEIVETENLKHCMAFAHSAYERADKVVSCMRRIVDGQLLLTDTAYAPLFKYALQASFIFNLLRYMLRATWLQRMLPESADARLVSDDYSSMINSLHGCCHQLQQLLESPACKLLQRDPAYLRDIEKLPKPTPVVISDAKDAPRAVHLDVSLAMHDWSYDIFNIASIAEVSSNMCDQAVNWARSVHFKVQSDIRTVYTQGVPVQVVFAAPKHPIAKAYSTDDLVTRTGKDLLQLFNISAEMK